MGQPEQFAKRTFEQETAALTHGAVVWKDPPETSLTHIQPDGRLIVRRRARLPPLDPPWGYVRGHDEIQLEIKMAGDHLNLPVIERILLRRQARQVERVEDADNPFKGQSAVWVVAPHVPKPLRAVWPVKKVAQGCYLVRPFVFQFVWIAANELPLRDDLVPFLVARSGPALDELARWVVAKRPPAWVLDMVQYTAMSNSARAHVINAVETDEPEVAARQRHVVQLLLAKHPEMRRELEVAARNQALTEGRKEGRKTGRRAEARAILRRLLARRGLVPTAAEEERIAACASLGTLELWIDQTLTAKSVEEALALPRPT